MVFARKPGISHSSSSVSCRRTKYFLPKPWISSFKSRCSRRLSKAASYLLVLVGCNCGKDGLREVECFHSIPNRDRFGGWKVTAEILADHVNSRLVFVHRVQNDLKWEGATLCQSCSKVPTSFQALMQIQPQDRSIIGRTQIGVGRGEMYKKLEVSVLAHGRKD